MYDRYNAPKVTIVPENLGCVVVKTNSWSAIWLLLYWVIPGVLM